MRLASRRKTCGRTIWRGSWTTRRSATVGPKVSTPRSAPRVRARRARARVFRSFSLRPRVEPSQRTVFCDAECLHSGKPAEYCAGPWYCSTTRVCETYNHRHQGKIVHHEWPKCARIKSCAHYEQCFPTEEQFQAMGFHEGTNAEFQELPVPNHTELAKGNGVPLSSPFKYNVMGFRVRRPLLSLFCARRAAAGRDDVLQKQEQLQERHRHTLQRGGRLRRPDRRRAVGRAGGAGAGAARGRRVARRGRNVIRSRRRVRRVLRRCSPGVFVAGPAAGRPWTCQRLPVSARSAVPRGAAYPRRLSRPPRTHAVRPTRAVAPVSTTASILGPSDPLGSE